MTLRSLLRQIHGLAGVAIPQAGQFQARVDAQPHQGILCGGAFQGVAAVCFGEVIGFAAENPDLKSVVASSSALSRATASPCFVSELPVLHFKAPLAGTHLLHHHLVLRQGAGFVQADGLHRTQGFYRLQPANQECFVCACHPCPGPGWWWQWWTSLLAPAATAREMEIFSISSRP